MNDDSRNNKLPEEILKLCFEIPAEGIDVFWPQDQHVERLVLNISEKDRKTFCQNNGRLAFVDENGKLYVTPYCFEVRVALNDANYKKGGLYVPFSNWDCPNDFVERGRWKSLSDGAIKAFKKRQEDERKARFKMEAENRKIQKLPQELYNMCIEIPEGGMEVKYIGNDKPSRLDGLEDSQVIERMGSYSINNGILAFVDGEGRWFVTPFTKEAAQILDVCGYKDEGMNYYVPFSNGDVPANPLESFIWKELINKQNKASGIKF